jgi:hypothetical protein
MELELLFGELGHGAPPDVTSVETAKDLIIYRLGIGLSSGSFEPLPEGDLGLLETMMRLTHTPGISNRNTIG